MTVRMRPNALSTVVVRGDTKLGTIVEKGLIDLLNDTIVIVHCSLPVTTEEHQLCHETIIRVHNTQFITV